MGTTMTNDCSSWIGLIINFNLTSRKHKETPWRSSKIITHSNVKGKAPYVEVPQQGSQEGTKTLLDADKWASAIEKNHPELTANDGSPSVSSVLHHLITSSEKSVGLIGAYFAFDGHVLRVTGLESQSRPTPNDCIEAALTLSDEYTFGPSLEFHRTPKYFKKIETENGHSIWQAWWS